MNKTLDSLRALTAKNAALLASATKSQGAVVDSSHKELGKINQQLAAIAPHETIIDPLKDREYRRLVFQRAALHKLLADE